MRVVHRMLAAVAAFGALVSVAAAQVPDHGPWDRLLGRYVVGFSDGVNRVDYARWKANAADRAALDGYIAALERTPVSQLSGQDQFAFWANLYNAVTIDVVLDAYPVRSIRDIPSRGVAINPTGGPWKMKLVTVEGRRLSLDDIEHGTMRPVFRDPLVHYAVNCASYGCPNLQRRAFRGAELDAQLAAAAREFINHPRAVTVTDRGLRLSSIYTWFRSDFGNEAQLKAHLARYAAPPLAQALGSNPRLAGHGYDWALNDIPR